MGDRARSEWAELRKSVLDTPEAQAEYERTRQSLLRTRQILQRLDAERQRAGLTKAALAARIGSDPSVVRRLFSSAAGNPTLQTVMQIADALDVEFDVRPRRASLPGRRSARRPAAA